MDRTEEIYQSAGKRHQKIVKAERKEQVCSISLETEEKGASFQGKGIWKLAPKQECR